MRPVKGTARVRSIRAASTTPVRKLRHFVLIVASLVVHPVVVVPARRCCEDIPTGVASRHVGDTRVLARNPPNGGVWGPLTSCQTALESKTRHHRTFMSTGSGDPMRRSCAVGSTDALNAKSLCSPIVPWPLRVRSGLQARALTW